MGINLDPATKLQMSTLSKVLMSNMMENMEPVENVNSKINLIDDNNDNKKDKVPEKKTFFEELDSDSDADSSSIYAAPCGNILEAEVQAKMIEDYRSELLVAKNPEKCHIKSQALCSKAERSDENNIVFLSGHLHDYYDGINCSRQFYIQYVAHENQKVDCPKFSEDAHIANPYAKYHRTVVNVVCVNVEIANVIGKYLRGGTQRLDLCSFQTELYFLDANAAKRYLEWKMDETIKSWQENYMR